MDAFSGYNQIPMFEQDEESTTFITNQGLFCYRVMSFGLKNAWATYQRLVNKIFKPLIERLNTSHKISSRFSQESETYVSDLSVGGFMLGKHPACSDLFLCTQESVEKRSYKEGSWSW